MKSIISFLFIALLGVCMLFLNDQATGSNEIRSEVHETETLEPFFCKRKIIPDKNTSNESM